MAQSPPYEFSAVMHRMYRETHQWLDSQVGTNYRNRAPRLDTDTMREVASHFHYVFPTHYFKVLHTLECVIAVEWMQQWLDSQDALCFVDMACGAGVASAAFLSSVVSLQSRGLLRRVPDIHCIGIDPSRWALSLYSRVLGSLAAATAAECCSDVSYCVLDEANPGVAGSLADRLGAVRARYSVPYLPCVIVVQCNPARAYMENLRGRATRANELERLGLGNAAGLPNSADSPAVAEVATYKTVMDDVGIDMMPIITIATTEDPDYSAMMSELRHATDRVFRERHEVEELFDGRHSATFVNPPMSHWGAISPGSQYSTEFLLNVVVVRSSDYSCDQQWHRVSSVENLRLAWARVRQSLLRDSLPDELEIRLFERDLEGNIKRMQRQLAVYAADLLHRSDALEYWVPKDDDSSRPRLLSRMEEEILSVAVIQVLGQRASKLNQYSYAYRLNYDRHRDTEYLYDYWFDSYRSFVSESRDAACACSNARVIRADIATYFTRIIQEELARLASTEMRTESRRVNWLLRCLLFRELGSLDHETGRGLSQGGVGSGFYANTYLTPVDELFGAGNQWDVRYFRYVDDMVLVVPDEADVNEVLRALKSSLADLGLHLNEAKTYACSTEEYLKDSHPDHLLESLNRDCRCLETPLWVVTDAYRHQLRRAAHDDSWWDVVEAYRLCLGRLGYYTDAGRLSRKLWQYLADDRRRERDMQRTLALCLPPWHLMFSDVSQWCQLFRRQNPTWVARRKLLQRRLAKLLRGCIAELPAADSETGRRARQLERRLRFCANRLCRLGLDPVVGELVEILRLRPWMLRQPRPLIDALALQGNESRLRELLSYYANRGDSAMACYMRALAVRGLRSVPRVSRTTWQIAIGASAVASTPAEKLMLLETCLHLIAKEAVPDESVHELTQLVDVTPDEEQNRLLKNRLLLGSALGCELPEVVSCQWDPLVLSAIEVSCEGMASYLTIAPEPAILRESYYSGEYPEAIDDMEPSM